MSQHASSFRIGVFVLGALALAVLAVSLFSSGLFHTDRSPRVSYFRGSISGLSVGAPVTFRGVKVGEVTEIRLRVDVKTLDAMIPVEYYVDRSKINWTNGAVSDVSVEKLVETGLRAQLVMVSFVTGQQTIDLDIHPDVPAVFLAPPGSTMPEVPVMQSAFEQVKQRLTNLPIQEIAEKVLKTVTDLDELVAAPETKQTLESLAKLSVNTERLEREDLAPALASLHRLIDDADATLVDAHAKLDMIGDMTKTANESLRILTPSLQRTLDDADQATISAKKSLDAVSSLLGAGQASRGDLNETLRDLALTTRALRDFADEIRRDPSTLVVGKH